MLSLPVITWVRFLVWLNIGFVIYWFYGRTHSPLADAAEAERRSGLQKLANFVAVFGLLGLFSAGSMSCGNVDGTRRHDRTRPSGAS